MTFIQKDLQDETANIIVYKNIFLLLLQVVTLQGFLILLFDNSGFVIENELINKDVKKNKLIPTRVNLLNFDKKKAFRVLNFKIKIKMMLWYFCKSII